MLNIQNIKFLKLLMEQEESLKIVNISKRLNRSERSIRYDMGKINEVLKEKGFPLIINEGKGYLKLNSDTKCEEYIKKIELEFKVEPLPKDRIDYLLFKSVYFGEINISKEMKELDISRTTIKSDFKELKKYLTKYGLELNIASNKGLKLMGKEENIRLCQLELFQQYKKNKIESIRCRTLITNYLNNFNDDEVKKFINEIQKKLEIVISDEGYEIIHNYLILAIKRLENKKALTGILNEFFLKGTQEYQVAREKIIILEKKYKVDFAEIEILKLCDFIMGSHTYNIKYSYYDNWVKIETLVKKVINKFNEFVNIDISKDKSLLDGLINHIKPTIYRLKKEMKLPNSIYDDVIKNYKNLYDITTLSIKELENFIEAKFTKDEIAFLTIYFKTAIERNEGKRNKAKKILIVCGLGYGTSQLLAQQIKSRYNVEIEGIIPFHKLDHKDMNTIDLIITTLNTKKFSDKKPVIQVTPLLEKDDLNKLNNYLEESYNKKFLLSELLETIEGNTVIKNRENLISQLKEVTKGYLVDDLVQPKIGLLNLLKLENIKLDLQCSTWMDSIKLGGELLLKNGYIKKEYIREMIEVVNKYGSYIVISPNIALPHARNTNNVIKTGISIIRLKDQIMFPNEKNVKIVITLCSKDNKEHLDGLVELTELLNLKEFKEEILKAKDKEEILNYIEQKLISLNL